MARRGDGAGRLSPHAPVLREFSAGGLVYRRRRAGCSVVLAGRRRAETGRLTWGLPKGHVERGESAAAAALREVREETGIDAVIEQPLGDLTYWYVRHDDEGRMRRVHKRVRFFLMRWRGGRFADRDDEMDEVRWFDVAEAEATLSHANERALLQRARTLLSSPAGPAPGAAPT